MSLPRWFLTLLLFACVCVVVDDVSGEGYTTNYTAAVVASAADAVAVTSAVIVDL